MSNCLFFKDPINEIKSLAKYLGKDLNEDQIKSIMDYCSFNKLKSNPAFETKMNLMSEGKEAQPQVKTLKLFRKGEIGDWKNYFTEEMSKRVDELVEANLKYSRPLKYEPTLRNH